MRMTSVHQGIRFGMKVQRGQIGKKNEKSEGYTQ